MTEKEASASMGRETIVARLSHASKKYIVGEQQVDALRAISLDIERGQFVAITGPSGSGKSTCMAILGCLDVLTSGNYELDGVDVCSLSHDELAEIRNHRIGYVFQGFNLLARMNARENVELPLIYAGVSKSVRRQRAMDALIRVGLEQRANHHPAQLSGGQQQRVAIARALVNEPSIILADEPTGNLDSATSEEIIGQFRLLNKSGITVVMVTHELALAACTGRQVSFRDGRIVDDRTPMQ